VYRKDEPAAHKLLRKRFPGDPGFYDPADKLLALIDYANPDRYWIKPSRRKELRRRFDEKKVSHLYTRYWVCLGRAQCFHHITPISRGGSYHWKNVVELCHFCHFRVHPHLQRAS
jgi:5-methylcytosine-specific restriction endonuclease McrA